MVTSPRFIECKISGPSATQSWWIRCHTLLIYKDDTTTSLREDTTLIFENLHTNNQHPDGVTGESFKRIVQENRVRESFKRTVKENRLISTPLFRTHEWDIVNVIHLWKIQVALTESRLIWKCAKAVFLKIKIDFKVDLKSRLKFMGCLVIKVVFKMCQNPPFYLLVVD